MSRLTFATLFSGSSGNAVYIRYGEDAILIDAGRSCRYIENALAELGEDPARLRAIFITHEHDDHTKALAMLDKKYALPVFVPERCFGGITIFPKSAQFYGGDCQINVGPFLVRSFPLPHDSRACVGYTVNVGNVKLGIATDMGMIAENAVSELVGCRAALIECNYDEEMLKYGPYRTDLKARIAGRYGHLSNSDGAALATYLAYSGTERILLGHLSQENNTPEKALDAVRREFEKRGVSAYIAAADREKPTVLWEVEL